MLYLYRSLKEKQMETLFISLSILFILCLITGFILIKGIYNDYQLNKRLDAQTEQINQVNKTFDLLAY